MDWHAKINAETVIDNCIGRYLYVYIYRYVSSIGVDTVAPDPCWAHGPMAHGSVREWPQDV